MIDVQTRVVALYAEKSSRQWVVRDREGNYWILPPTSDPWEQRQPFNPAETTELQPVPGHYKYVLGLP